MRQLKVRTSQLRRLRASAWSFSINSDYRRHGPSSLSRGPRGETDGIQHPSLDDVSSFWESIIGVEREWDPQDPYLVNWALGMSDTPMPSAVEPVDGRIWGKVVKKLNSWKARGHDGICGFWWKQFHQAALLLGRAVWGMLEGDSDSIPTWFVKGRTVLIPKRNARKTRTVLTHNLPEHWVQTLDRCNDGGLVQPCHSGLVLTSRA